MKKNSLLAIIPAAGIGQRFGSEIPKQYMSLDGKSVIERATEPFILSQYVSKIIIATSENDSFIKEQSFYNNEKVEFVIGGNTRSRSILNCIKSISVEDYEYVITHDAARPNIHQEDIENLYLDIISNKSLCSYFYIPIYDSIKNTTELDKTEDKNKFLLVQTPQICKLKELKSGIIECEKNNISIPDESFVFEHTGLASSKILGRRSNIKITEESDLDLLNKFNTRTGTGFDLHRYEEGKGIILGGYFLDCEFKIIAHSDGDVLLHSIADSILGASGLGDIGKYFSDKDPLNKDIDSKEIINFCLESIKKKNLEIYNVDATIICEQPKLDPHRDKVLKSLSKILKIPEEKIGLKATTSEKIGIIGRNKAIAVQSSVNLRTSL